MSSYNLHRRAAQIVQDAGGQLIGRTRLQKVMYLAQLAGFSSDFPFEYRHYGPFSEELATAMELASAFGLVNEEEKPTDWGGWYSVYRTAPSEDNGGSDSGDRGRFIASAAEIGAIELELAATAAFLYADEGIGQFGGDPWAETAKRKPDKASGGRLERAKSAYRKLMSLPAPRKLPEIA